MSIVSKAQLKNDFLTDKVITQPKMEDLIDSCYNSSQTVLQYDRTFTANELINIDYDASGDPYTGIEILPPPGAGKCYVKSGSSVVAVYTYDGDVFSTAVSNLQLNIYYPEAGPAQAAPDLIHIIALNSAFGGESLDVANAIEPTALLGSWSGAAQDDSVSAPGFINQPWYIGTKGLLIRNTVATNGTIHLRFQYTIWDLTDIWP